MLEGPSSLDPSSQGPQSLSLVPLIKSLNADGAFCVDVEKLCLQPLSVNQFADFITFITKTVSRQDPTQHSEIANIPYREFPIP